MDTFSHFIDLMSIQSRHSISVKGREGWKLPELPPTKQNPIDIAKMLIEGAWILGWYNIAEDLFWMYCSTGSEIMRYRVYVLENDPYHQMGLELEKVIPMNPITVNNLVKNELNLMGKLYYDTEGDIASVSFELPHKVTKEEIEKGIKKDGEFIMLSEYFYTPEEFEELSRSTNKEK